MTWHVSTRISPAVGTSFDFVEKNDAKKVLKKYGVEVINYEDVINYKTPDELRKMGFGKPSKIGDESGVYDDEDSSESDDDDDDVGLSIEDMDDDI